VIIEKLASHNSLGQCDHIPLKLRLRALWTKLFPTT
jgi:hypothetical protein